MIEALRRAQRAARAVAAIVAGTLLLASCAAVGPDYRRPPVAMPAAFQPMPGWQAASPADDAVRGDWWSAFHDPMLDRLMPQVAVSNQTVAVADAQWRQALALVQQARAGLYPSLGLTGSLNRASSSGAAAAQGVAAVTAGALEGTASWAPDLWGRVRRQVEQSRANAQMSAATLAGVTLAQQQLLASAVINLRASDAMGELLRRALAGYQQSLQVTQNKARAGTTPPSDSITARIQVENAQAALLNLGVARGQYAHAIAVLSGVAPEELSVAAAPMPQLPDVPVGVPSTLLERRTDVATQERAMAAANAGIGVAIGAYYPTVTVSALLGYAQSPLRGLIDVANRVWSLGSNASAPLFDAGARSAAVEAARAAYDGTVASYRQTVLTALQSVEDNLGALHVLGQQADVLVGAVRDAREGARIALNQYRAGTVDYTTVVTAQATQLSTEQNALTVRQQRLLDSVALIGALGGGWQAPARP